MASLMRKVFKGVSSKADDGKLTLPKSPPPMCPPSPDLSGLTPEEITILKDVFRRQEEFEREESERVRKISNDLDHFEKNVKFQASTKSKLKHVDIRLCRLCFKTKFADGIGKVCYDCHKRVCTKCGSFSKPRWNPKKNKSVRGRWRCNMCQMKRDAVCKTGSWYYRADLQSGERNNTFEKLRSSIKGDLEYDLVGRDHEEYPSDADKVASGNRTDSELYRSQDKPAEHVHSSNRKNRRRSLPVSHVIRADDEEDDEDNDMHMVRERKIFRQKRQLRKLRRRVLPECKTSEEESGAIASEYSEHAEENSSEINSETESNHRRPSLKVRKWSAPRLTVKEKSRSRSKASLDSTTDSSSLKSIATKESSLSDGASSPKLVNKIKRQDAVYCSSSSSLFSDAKCSDSQGGATSPLPLRHFRDHNTSVVITQDHTGYGIRHDLFNRRITLCKCELLAPGDKEQENRLANLRTQHTPHEVILHKDRQDRSHRTSGLGMRIVGGKTGDSDSLGAFVVTVTKGGPADVQGHIRAGDQILQWNGSSLIDVTFEEALSIMDQSGNVVQLVVLHRHLKRRISEDTDQRPPLNKIESEDWALCRKQTLAAPPDSLPLYRPRRRMLPKTPIEMKKETRRITGRIFMKLNYIPTTAILSVTLIKAEELSTPEGSEQTVPNPYALVHILPKRSLTPPQETNPQTRTRSPEWDDIFLFENITPSQLRRKSIEVTIWSQTEKTDEFLGEVLLDLSDANLIDEPTCYSLEDHDENSCPLPQRKRSIPDVPEPASSTSSDHPKASPSPSPMGPPRLLEPAARSLPAAPGNDQPRGHLKHFPGIDRKTAANDVLTPPCSSYTSGNENFSSGCRSSFTNKVKRKMTNAVSKMSSSLSVLEKKDSDDSSSHELNHSRSFGDESSTISPNRTRRQSTINLDLLAPPRPLSRTNSQSSFYENDSDGGGDPYRQVPLTPDRPAPEGDDITSILGPGQVPPKPSAENLVCGDIRLGFMVSKGQLEVDVICAKGLGKIDGAVPPDTYVKTYLVEEKKIIQKKKTQMIKGSFDPLYRRKIKYSACNVHGRHMKINIWERSKGFDKKQCLGETIVKLDSLDLSRHTMAWYKLFTVNATELGSNESLIHW